MIWNKRRFGDLFTEPTRNGIHKAVEFQGRGTPVVKMGEVYSSKFVDDSNERDFLDLSATELSKLTIETDDLLFCRTSLVADGVGRCALVRHLSRPTAFASNLIRVRLDPALADPRFYHFVFQSAMGLNFMRSIVRGTSVSTITGPDIANLEVPYPPMFEQTAIADVLAALDDKIESNHRLQSLLERTIAAEYQLLTQNRDLVEYRSALDVVMGVAFAGDFFSPNGVGRPLIRIRDLKSFVPQTWTTETRTDEVVVRAGEVVVGMDAEFRSTLWIGNDGLLNQRVCKFVPKPGVATAFAWCAIKPDLEYCERAKTGTTVIHLNKSDIERFSVPRLTVDEHQTFDAVTEPMLKRLVAAGIENMQIASLRNALLPELLSGRLRVRDAEAMMENV